jgi:hypothetical protein
VGAGLARRELRLVFGALADRVGVQTAFDLLGLVPLAALPFALLMRDPPRADRPGAD